MCKAVSGCTKVPSSKFISNVIAKSLRKFVFVRKFVSVHIFAQSVRSTYRVVKRCDFDLVNKVNINTRCSVSVCRKVRKSVLVSVSNNIFNTLAPYVLCSVQIVYLSSLKCQLLLSLSKFLCHRHTQSLLRFCLISFPLLNQQKLF